MSAPAVPGVPADLRLLDAMGSLLQSAEAMAGGELDPVRRAWALTHAQRTLAEAGGLDALSPSVRARVHTLGRRVLELDAKVTREVTALAKRLAHGLSEVRARQGEAALGTRTDRRG